MSPEIGGELSERSPPKDKVSVEKMANLFEDSMQRGSGFLSEAYLDQRK
jgi:hypothetical protein